MPLSYKPKSKQDWEKKHREGSRIGHSVQCWGHHRTQTGRDKHHLKYGFSALWGPRGWIGVRGASRVRGYIYYSWFMLFNSRNNNVKQLLSNNNNKKKEMFNWIHSHHVLRLIVGSTLTTLPIVYFWNPLRGQQMRVNLLRLLPLGMNTSFVHFIQSILIIYNECSVEWHSCGGHFMDKNVMLTVDFPQQEEDVTWALSENT